MAQLRTPARKFGERPLPKRSDTVPPFTSATSAVADAPQFSDLATPLSQPFGAGAHRQLSRPDHRLRRSHHPWAPQDGGPGPSCSGCDDGPRGRQRRRESAATDTQPGAQSDPARYRLSRPCEYCCGESVTPCHASARLHDGVTAKQPPDPPSAASALTAEVAQTSPVSRSASRRLASKIAAAQASLFALEPLHPITLTYAIAFVSRAEQYMIFNLSQSIP